MNKIKRKSKQFLILTYMYYIYNFTRNYWFVSKTVDWIVDLYRLYFSSRMGNTRLLDQYIYILTSITVTTINFKVATGNSIKVRMGQSAGKLSLSLGHYMYIGLAPKGFVNHYFLIGFLSFPTALSVVLANFSV